MTQDTLQQDSIKPQRKAKTLEDEIAIAREKLKRLEEKQREQQRKWREKNQKSIFELIRSEKLDIIDVHKWQSKINRIKEVLV